MVLKQLKTVEIDVEKFENDVKMYGTQALYCLCERHNRFENDVKMYGTQAFLHLNEHKLRLRMM